MTDSIFIHETAIIDHGAQIGDDTRIWHWVHVCAGAQIGNNCSFGQNVFVGNKVVIGNNVKIQNNVSVFDNVTLEDDVFCSPSMNLTNVSNPEETRVGFVMVRTAQLPVCAFDESLQESRMWENCTSGSSRGGH